MDDSTKNKQNKMIATQQTAIYSGPIPPPDILAKYEQLSAGLADRIVQMAETEGNHRRGLENLAMQSQIEHLIKKRLGS